MEKRSEQQRVNLDIAYELDKYQVMLEYGRLFLDRDKAIRDKYKWMSFVKSGCLSGVILEVAVAVITAIVSAETFTEWLPYMLAILLLILLHFSQLLLIYPINLDYLINFFLNYLILFQIQLFDYAFSFDKIHVILLYHFVNFLFPFYLYLILHDVIDSPSTHGQNFHKNLFVVQHLRLKLNLLFLLYLSIYLCNHYNVL